LHFERIRYWSDVLPVIAQPREPLIVRYDPRDISRLYVIGKDHHYHTTTYANITRPPISLEEVRAGDRTSRSLVDVEDPAVRGSALWFAHSVMASFHQDASDRQTAYRRTSRHELKYAASPPASRAWLASRMSTWPERYRSKCWLNPLC
jgi:putative transposase